MLTQNPNNDLTPFNPRERHYTLYEIASWWNVSYDYARDTFKDEPGVLKLRKPRKKPHQKIRTHYRVPEHVVIRVRRRLTGGEL